MKDLSIKSIDDILKKTGLESFSDSIKEKLKIIGTGRELNQNMYANEDDYLDAVDRTFSVVIINPKPKPHDNITCRIYNSLCNYSELNYLHAIRLTNELFERVDENWFDILDLVLNESTMWYSAISADNLETNQNNNYFNCKDIFSSETNYPYRDSDEITF